MFQIFFDNRDKTLQERTAEIQSKVDQYKAAQLYQIEYGGPGPVADYDIMAIVNEHDSQFEVILPPEVVIDDPEAV